MIEQINFIPLLMTFLAFQNLKKLTLTEPIVFVAIQSFFYRNQHVAPGREFATVLFLAILVNPNLLIFLVLF